MQFCPDFFKDEVRSGFFVPTRMKRWWAAQLQVLADIDRVCKKYDISYFLTWGTLLGAWRHQGYVPWDDDLDIGMLRPDYMRFMQLAPAELGEWYQVHSFYGDEEFPNFVTRVAAGDHFRTDRAFLAKFHGCPYVAGIDIFPYDYVAPTEEENQAQLDTFLNLQKIASAMETMEPVQRELSLQRLEKEFATTIDRRGSLLNQCLQLADQVAAQYQEGDYVSSMWHRQRRKEKRGIDFKFKTDSVKNLTTLPFEGRDWPVPGDTEAFLCMQYPGYQNPIRRMGAHGYPAYEAQEEAVAEAGGKGPYQFFTFDKTKLPVKKQRPTVVRDILAGLLETLSGVSLGLPGLIAENPQEAVFLLEDIQDAVISVGTNIETLYGEGHPTVGTLEGYCEALYELHEKILDAAAYTDSITSLAAALDTVRTSATAHILDRKEVIFLPLCAAHWKVLAPYYEAAKADPAWDVYVIPLPYTAIDQYGYPTPEGTIHELYQFPAGVTATHYLEFAWDAHSLDVMFITDPYDGDSLTHNVDANFYSDKLAEVAGRLIYIPPYPIGPIGPKDELARLTIRAITNTPGVTHADTVIVPGPGHQAAYVDNLVAWAGEDTRDYWEQKIVIRQNPVR